MAMDQMSIASFNPPHNARNHKEDRGKENLREIYFIDTTIEQIDLLLKKAN